MSTAARLADRERGWVRGRRIAQPMPMPEHWDRFAALREAPAGTMLVPTMRLANGPRDIAEMDEALGWLLWLDVRPRTIVMARAAGARWRSIGRELGLSRGHCCRLRDAGLDLIAGRLNAANFSGDK